MLVVLTIIGLATAVVVPALPPLMPEDPVTRVGHEIAGLLREARREALHRVEPVALVIDPGTGRYWLAERDGVIGLSPGITLVTDTNRARFTFTPTGPANGSSVVVRGPSGVRTLTVDRWTGAPIVRAP